MEVEKTEIPEVLLIKPRIFGDSRGAFYESYNEKRYKEFGITGNFCQDNVSFSEKGVLRGLHFQNPNGQGKLVSVLEGEVLDVAVDIRIGSPTFGKHVTAVLSSQNKHQFFVPSGFAHGFVVRSNTAIFCYKCTDFYAPTSENTLLWNDPELNIDWGIDEPLLSDKDQKGLSLKELKDRLPKYS